MGPGCSLPSRFITLLPYKPWFARYMIRSSVEIEKRNENYHLSYRKYFAKNPNIRKVTKINLRQKGRLNIVHNIEQDSYDDNDTATMKMLANESLVLETGKNLKYSQVEVEHATKHLLWL